MKDDRVVDDRVLVPSSGRGRKHLGRLLDGWRYRDGETACGRYLVDVLDYSAEEFDDLPWEPCSRCVARRDA